MMFGVFLLPRQYHKSNERDKWENINSISGLREAGIKFKRAKDDDNLMDIKFVNGVLRIPQLIIYDETESQLMNLIAYEQYMSDGERRYFSDYTFFMHCLINTSNDVELLRSCGIIENCLGMTKNVNRHCQRRGKRWKANLHRNYFNSPWTIISFLAAVALLVLTLTQTTYTVLTYYNRKR
ncbi:hypothetical protein Sango_0584100 [Sesamum angolense]|uniref:Uncharacterized protein n=1 Tax=Sesamum angolense TaxID=2727404 RepID=A0AAE1X5Y7_9LAMI|nr:hypothetical protein Sango_0584100 [Sesamum angolense]